MSTTSAAIRAPASVVPENLVRPLARGRLRDHDFLRVTRWAVLLFSILACIMAVMRSNIYALVAESSILSLVSLFIPLVFGIYWRRSSAGGALASMVLGMLTWIIFEFSETEWPSLIPATLAGTAAMIAGSFMWPETLYRHDQDRAQSFE